MSAEEVGFIEQTGKTKKALVIAFSTLQHGQKPSFDLLKILGKKNIDTIFIRDTESLWYQAGTKGAIGNFDKIIDYLRPRISGYRSIITIGTSMGGHAAMAATSAIRRTKACIAISPQTFLNRENRLKYKDDRWSDRMSIINNALKETPYFDIRKLYQSQKIRTPVYLFYGQNALSDKNHAMYVKDLENVRTFEVKGAGPTAGQIMRDTGVLDKLLNQLINTSRYEADSPYIIAK